MLKVAMARRTFSPVSGRTRKLHRTDQRAKELEATIFALPQNQSRPKLRAFVRGTPFQLRVWRGLLQVPAGSLTTYGRLSAAIEQPQAARAVGSAVGANPIAFIIPCHRVIPETGVVGNYRWDPIRKRAMIGWEISALAVAEGRRLPTGGAIRLPA